MSVGKTLIGALAALLITNFVPAANAAGNRDANLQSVSIQYRDLDLGHTSGVAALNHRIARAADIVCGPVDHRDLLDVEDFNACRKTAIANAMPKMEAAIAAHNNSRVAANDSGMLTVR